MENRNETLELILHFIGFVSASAQEWTLHSILLKAGG